MWVWFMGVTLLQALYSRKIGADKLEILKDSNDVDTKNLDPMKVSCLLV